MYVLLKPFPKINIKMESSSIAWLVKEKETHTHTKNSVDANVLFSQYLISYSGEKGGEKGGERMIVLI